MSEGTIRLERLGHVGVITMDRPAKLNTFTVEMDRRLNSLTREINTDSEIRAVVLTGAGDRAFCAGSDITNLDGYGSNWEYRNRFDRGEDYVNGIWRIRKPVVAAINGYAIGGGLELACASDIRLATPASKFGAGEIKWGWHGGSGATQFLTRAIGPGYASKLLFTGDMIDGEEAYRIGLVQELHSPDTLTDKAMRLATTIASRGPIAVQSTKNLVRIAQSASTEVGLAYENDMFAYCMATHDAAEGRAAFAEGRQPVFRGE